ncbi:MAG: site-2 protease family protein [Polyangiaceae bacterium]
MPPVRRRSESAWTWTIAHVAGIDVRIHATFLVLLLWVLVSNALGGRGLTAAATGVAFILVVFAVIVLHELGHALAARHYGIRTRDITLLPIGGIARLERIPTVPSQELVVALAGPAVNVVLAGLAAGLVALFGVPWSTSLSADPSAPALTRFLWLNVFLAVFNLLPAFPMDGGRALRAMLSIRLGRVRATDVAAAVGRWAALAFGALGVFGNPMLIFVALFVWVGASQEARMVHVMAALDRVRVSDVMVIDFEVMPADATIGQAIGYALHSLQVEFPVVDAGRFLGFVSVGDLVAATSAERLLRVRDVARPADDQTSPEELAEPALERLERSESGALPVLDDGRLVGLFVPQNALRLAELRDTTRRLAEAT